VGGLIAEVMGKQSGVCGGRGGSQHLCAGGVFSSVATVRWARERSTRR
jgi:TPP-dependent pyruvate/acetoin dehydrogenase alpha subunit